MACRSGCPTQDHANWGECARAANLKIAYAGIGGGDYSSQKRWDAELAAYKDARAQGIQPKGTKMKDIRAAVEISDKSGKAFDATRPAIL